MTDNELNELVAEKVMGFVKLRYAYKTPYPIADGTLLGTIDGQEKPIPDYANDIAAAWSLTEEEDKFILRSLEHKWDYWLVWYQRTIDGDAEYVTAPTAPRAICLAALEAVGVEVE